MKYCYFENDSRALQIMTCWWIPIWKKKPSHVKYINWSVNRNTLFCCCCFTHFIESLWATGYSISLQKTALRLIHYSNKQVHDTIHTFISINGTCITDSGSIQFNSILYRGQHQAAIRRPFEREMKKIYMQIRWCSPWRPLSFELQLNVIVHLLAIYAASMRQVNSKSLRHFQSWNWFTVLRAI